MFNVLGNATGGKIKTKFRLKSEKRTASGSPFIWRVFAPGCDQNECDRIGETFDLTSANTIDLINQFDEKSCCKWIPNKVSKDFQNFECTPSFLGTLYNITSLKKTGGWPCVRMMDKLNDKRKKKGDNMNENDYWFAGQMQMSPDFGLFKKFDVDTSVQENEEDEISWRPKELGCEDWGEQRGCFKGKIFFKYKTPFRFTNH